MAMLAAIPFRFSMTGVWNTLEPSEEAAQLSPEASILARFPAHFQSPSNSHKVEQHGVEGFPSSSN
jgi:hypothetical protein